MDCEKERQRLQERKEQKEREQEGCGSGAKRKRGRNRKEVGSNRGPGDQLMYLLTIMKHRKEQIRKSMELWKAEYAWEVQI